jgi:hypothetical protein
MGEGKMTENQKIEGWYQSRGDMTWARFIDYSSLALSICGGGINNIYPEVPWGVHAVAFLTPIIGPAVSEYYMTTGVKQRNEEIKAMREAGIKCETSDEARAEAVLCATRYSLQKAMRNVSAGFAASMAKGIIYSDRTDLAVMTLAGFGISALILERLGNINRRRLESMIEEGK